MPTPQPKEPYPTPPTLRSYRLDFDVHGPGAFSEFPVATCYLDTDAGEVRIAGLPGICFYLGAIALGLQVQEFGEFLLQ